MAFNFRTLVPKIQQILSAPDTDLESISAKRVRRQLPQLDPALTPEFLKANRETVDAIIQEVYSQLSAQAHQEQEGRHPQEHESDPSETDTKHSGDGEEYYYDDDDDDGVDREEEGEEEAEEPVKKKVKTKTKTKTKTAKKATDSDAKLARQLSNEINGRPTRRGSASKSRAWKSAAMIDSDEDEDEDGSSPRKKRKRSSAAAGGGGGGGAKGGFAKEFLLRCVPPSCVLSRIHTDALLQCTPFRSSRC
jgi:upstream activation factor subunit UAF30